MTNLVIVEPDPLRCEGLIMALARGPRIRVLSSGATLLEALSGIPPFTPVDMVLLNIDDPEMMSWRSWALLRLAQPDSSIVALTQGGDDSALEAAVAIGVRGLCKLPVGGISIRSVVQGVIRGELCYDPKLVDEIRKSLMYTSDPDRIRVRMGQLTVDVGKAGGQGSVAALSLTRRERQVLTLLSQGKSNQQIAQELTVAVRTAAFHVGNVLSKLHVSSRAEAGLLAQWLENGLQGIGGRTTRPRLGPSI